MRDNKFSDTLAKILWISDISAVFDIMVQAIRLQEFDFVKTYLDNARRFNEDSCVYVPDFAASLLFDFLYHREADIEIVEFLFDNYNISPNSYDKKYRTLFELALIQKNGIEIAEYLRAKGAEPTLTYRYDVYSFVLRKVGRPYILRTFEYMDHLGIKIEKNALCAAISECIDERQPIIEWLLDHSTRFYNQDKEVIETIRIKFMQGS